MGLETYISICHELGVSGSFAEVSRDAADRENSVDQDIAAAIRSVDLLIDHPSAARGDIKTPIAMVESEMLRLIRIICELRTQLRSKTGGSAR